MGCNHSAKMSLQNALNLIQVLFHQCFQIELGHLQRMTLMNFSNDVDRGPVYVQRNRTWEGNTSLRKILVGIFKIKEECCHLVLILSQLKVCIYNCSYGLSRGKVCPIFLDKICRPLSANTAKDINHYHHSPPREFTCPQYAVVATLT